MPDRTSRIALMNGRFRVEYYADVEWTDNAAAMVQLLLVQNANHRSGAGADSEAIEAERGAEIRASLGLLGLKRDAGRVGHSVDRIE